MKPSGNLQIISALLAGAGAGIIMAAVMLFLMSAYGFHFHVMSAAAAGMVAVALPWCMDVLKRRGLNLFVCEGTAVLVSAVSGARAGNHDLVSESLSIKIKLEMSSQRYL